MKALLTKSIEHRALAMMANGIDPVEAVKQALIDETNMIGTLINSNSRLTERGTIAGDYIRERIYKRLVA